MTSDEAFEKIHEEFILRGMSSELSEQRHMKKQPEKDIPAAHVWIIP